MHANQCQIVLGEKGLEITREPVADNVMEILVYGHIVNVFPIFIENPVDYRFPTATIVKVVMSNETEFEVELQEVTNQATWNGGTLADIKQAVADISLLSTPPSLTLTFDDISNAPVADPSDVSDWNTLITSNGGNAAYTAVQVVGDSVILTGDTGVTLGNTTFAGVTLISIVDTGTVVGFDSFVFGVCALLTEITFLAVTNFGGSTSDDNSFVGIIGNNITLTIPAALMTCDAGNPDGDIVTMQANNTVTVITT